MRRLLVLFVLLAGCADDTPRGLEVSCAASAAGALEEIAAAYESATGVPVRVSAGASSLLARQIERGAPADVFLSADPAWTARLVERGLAPAGAPRDVLGNRLVVVVPAGALETGLFPSGRIAIGDPDHVPVGLYARLALVAAGRWDEVQERLLPAPDARATLRLVEMGEAASGIVYASDARASDRVRVLAELPLPGDGVRYAITVLRGAAPEAAAFVDFVCGDDAAGIFERAGFVPLSGETSRYPRVP